MELPVRWGFIGCGNVTEKKSCPAAFTRSGVSSVVAVSRRDEYLAGDYAARHGVQTSYSGGPPAAPRLAPG
jgi:predicted dehydrogenase